MNPKSLNKIIEDSIKKNWDCPALSDYNGVTLYFCITVMWPAG